MRTELRRGLFIAILGAVLLASGRGGAPVSAQSTTPEALTFFKNYFITGDYIVRSVGLRGRGVDGLATGQIRIPAGSVPPNADIVSALLYWQVVTKETLGPESGASGVKFNGYELSTLDGPIAKVLDRAGTSPCWSSGGGTGSSGGIHKTYSYMADVARFLELNPATGKPLVNGATYSVAVPDSGPTGNGVPIALGASLLLVVRDSSLPLRAIVVHHDGFTVDNGNRTMTQTIKGFYQPSANPDATVTYMVGSAQANKNEIVSFNGALLATSPFGAYDGPSWDSPTFPVTLGSSPTTLSQVTTTIDTNGVSAGDCLTPIATVFKTNVLDTDGDGLLDIWEESLTPLLDPHGQPLPLLSAMGADKSRKDAYIEIGSMYTTTDSPYGGVMKPAHTHRPGHEALKLVGDAFKNAPEPIAVHFDGGADYPLPEPGQPSAEEYLVPRALARGGEQIDEATTVCTWNPSDPPWACQYPDYRGVVGWKTGFRYLRDEILSGEPAPLPGEEDVCDLPGNSCLRRFDRNRKDIFHYAFFSHFVAVPKSDKPCLVLQEIEGVPVEVPADDVGGTCPYKHNPDFRVPRTISGVGDFFGGDILVALGGFKDANEHPVGTPFMQASTLLHEFGHNGGRRHGGEESEPNCKPTYLSAMNYLYQLRGLKNNFGVPHLDLSRAVIDLPLGGGPVNETQLTDGLFAGILPFRIGWYAPLAGSYLENQPGVQPAGSHCDGTPLLPTDVPSVRVDAQTAAGAIDWNADGSAQSSYALDVNFNGRRNRLSDGAPELLKGSEDWSKLLLNQVGSRRNVGGVYLDRSGNYVMGPLSLDLGRFDWGRFDWGRFDWGRFDWGKGDNHRGDLGQGDLGRFDWGRFDWGRFDWGQMGDGRGDLGRGDKGGGDLFVGDPDNPGGELDAETATELFKSPPNEFTACVIGVDCTTPFTPLHQVRLGWKLPNEGGVQEYKVYRVFGDSLDDGAWTEVATVTAVRGQIDYEVIDATQLVHDALYTYFAVGVYELGIQSEPSNQMTIRAVNEPPAAANDSYSTAEDAALVETAPGVLGNDADPDTASTLTAVLVSGPSHGTVTLNAGGSFTYTPAADYNGADSFSYKATDGVVDSNVATVDITVTAVNDVPLASGDAYSTPEDTALTGNVLGNDSDVEGPLSAVLGAGPSHGSLVLNPDGSFTYTPAANYSGADSFTYTAFDGTTNSGVAAVTISVLAINDPPVALADSYSTSQGLVLTVPAPGLLANDSDVDSALTAVVVSGPANGVLVLNPNGSFTYTPAPTFFGTDAFTYAASDGTASTPATVTIAVQRLSYGFIGVLNLPPPAGKQFNVGSAVPLQWRFTLNGVVHNSVNAQPQIVVLSSAGAVIYQGHPGDPGSSSFQPPTLANGYTWQFNWQTKGLTAGTYYVWLGSLQTGQTYANGQAFGPFAVSLKTK